MGSFNITGSLKSNPKPIFGGLFSKKPTQSSGMLGSLQPRGDFTKIAQERLGQPTQYGNQQPTHPETPKVQPTSHVITTKPDGSTTTRQTYAPTTSGVMPPKNQQVGNQMQNAQNVLDSANLNNNPQYQALAAQNSLLTQAQNNLSTAGTAGSQNTVNQKGTDLLGTQYSDIFRPQSTANLRGEKGILNPQLINAMAGNTAEANRLLSGAELATTGATSVLGAGAPQLGSPGSVPYNPLTGQQGALLGTQGGGSGLFGAGQIQGQINLGQQYPQLQSAHMQSQGIKNTIQSYLTANPGLNPVNATAINAALQWAQGKQLGDPKYQTLMNYLNEYTSTLAPILGVGGDPTNLKTEIAQSFINAQANGQSISDVLNSLDALAAGKLQAMANAGNAPIGGGSNNTSGGTNYNF